MEKITEGSLEWYRTVLNQIISSDMTIYQNQKDCFDLLLNMNIDLPFDKNQEARKMAMKVSQYSHNIAEKCAALTGSGDFDDIYWQYLLLEAPHLLDSYAMYIEKDRKPEERFYLPRRRTLKKVVDKLQALEEDGLDELFLHQPARTGKSQIITVGAAWHCARNSEISNLYVTYKEGLGGAFLDGVMEIWTDPTYCHEDVFHSKIARTDAKNHKVDLERKKKYATLSGKGLESGLRPVS